MTNTEIAAASKIMLGTTEAVAMYIGSNKIWELQTGPIIRLPQGYTEVEYIENTSTAYINTEVLLYDSPTNSYNIQCKCYFQPYGNGFEYLFGTEQTSDPYTGVTLRYYQSNIEYSSVPNNVSWTHIDNGDGTSSITASCSSTTATNGDNPLTLFGGLWSSGLWRNGRGKIYSFKVTKNNTLVRDLVPCKRDSDDKYGMYDLVTNTFYFSPNNIDFSGGNPIIKLPQGYTKLEYISSTSSGGLYINLDIKLYETLGIDYDIAIKFNLKGNGKNTSQQATIFSNQDPNNSPWPGVFIRLTNNSAIGRYIGGSAKDNDLGSTNSVIELPALIPPSKNVTDLNNPNNTTHQYNASLFCGFSDTNDTPLRFANADMYYFKLFVNGTIVRYLIPCKDTNNVVGMYDVVNNVFYTSPNGAAFVAGPAV